MFILNENSVTIPDRDTRESAKTRRVKIPLRLANQTRKSRLPGKPMESRGLIRTSLTLSAPYRFHPSE